MWGVRTPKIKIKTKPTFHRYRDRLNTGTKDIFTECGKIDDQALKIAVADGAGDVFLDLQTFEDNTLEEGFGGAVSQKSGVNSGNIVHQSMIKRFNQHSTMVGFPFCFPRFKTNEIDFDGFRFAGSEHLFTTIGACGRDERSVKDRCEQEQC